MQSVTPPTDSLPSLTIPGDQHKPTNAKAPTLNPYEPPEQRISTYTAQEIATLQSRLDKQLGPEYISSRPGASGQKVHYLAAEKVIGLANEIFGFNGWSSSIQNIQIDFVDENATTGRVSLGLSVIVRVTLRDGTYHEDVGYGHIENCKGKAAAFEKCKKEGTTDAMKRALRTFGNVLGNCIYDKDFVSKVMKVKVGAGRFDVNELHRHQDFVPKKDREVKEEIPAQEIGDDSISTMIDMDETFDIADFDDVDLAEGDFDHPDEVVLPAESVNKHQLMGPPARNGVTTPSRPMSGRTTTASVLAANRSTHTNATGFNTAGQGVSAASGPQQQGNSPLVIVRPVGQNSSNDDHHLSSLAPPPQHFVAPVPSEHIPQVGFYSARAATALDAENKAVMAAPRFNPHAESPSIRKTPGVDHTKTAPIKHATLPCEVPRDFIDPRTDSKRRLGGSVQGGHSPMTKNTSAYRPPTKKGPDPVAGTVIGDTIDKAPPAAKRAPLNDVSNTLHAVTAMAEDGTDTKRQRILGPQDLGDKGTENARIADAGCAS